MNFYLKDLVYRHPKANDLIFDKLNLPLSLGPLLLLGRNGAGKTTLLKLIVEACLGGCSSRWAGAVSSPEIYCSTWL